MKVVFLFDGDNTLLDNDRVATDLRRHLDAEVGAHCGSGYALDMVEVARHPAPDLTVRRIDDLIGYERDALVDAAAAIAAMRRAGVSRLVGGEGGREKL